MEKSFFRRATKCTQRRLPEFYLRGLHAAVRVLEARWKKRLGVQLFLIKTDLAFNLCLILPRFLAQT